VKNGTKRLPLSASPGPSSRTRNAKNSKSVAFSSIG
jgi:hypothetical protein